MFYRREIDIVGQPFCQLDFATNLSGNCVLKKRFFSMKIKRRDEGAIKN